MEETKYVCEGTCNGSVNEEQFRSGMNKCGTEGCPKKGEPLVKKE